MVEYYNNVFNPENMVISINGNVVSTINLVANKSSDKLSFGSIIKFVMNKWFNMLR